MAPGRPIGAREVEMGPNVPIQEKTLSNVVRTLEARPLYAAVFGICLLIVIVAAIAATRVPDPNRGLLIAAALAALVVALLVLIRASKLVEPTPVPPAPSPPEPNKLLEKRSTNTEVNELLGQLLSRISEAVKIEHPILLGEVRHELVELRNRAEKWARGEHWAGSDGYSRVLIELYRTARSSVFSTAVPEYLASWDAQLGQQMLDAHQDSEATVTRVFVFERRTDITPAAMAIMQRQSEHPKISVLVYINQEETTFNFPPIISRDFTVIDGGEVIGVTATFGDNLTAIWYFRDKNMSEEFRRYSKGLEAGSIPFATIKKWWNEEGDGIVDHKA
jgi:hypothetical protein